MKRSRIDEVEIRLIRNNFQIIAKIIEVAKKEVILTRILYNAGIPYISLKKYIGICVESGFLLRKTKAVSFSRSYTGANKLSNNPKKKEKMLYKATEKGLRFAQNVRELERLLEIRKSY